MLYSPLSVYLHPCLPAAEGLTHPDFSQLVDILKTTLEKITKHERFMKYALWLMTDTVVPYDIVNGMGLLKLFIGLVAGFIGGAGWQSKQKK